MFRRRNTSVRNQEDETLQQDAKVKELKAAIGPILLSGSSSIEKYCTDSCLRRYLEAWDWNVEKSRKLVEGTIKWRSIYKPEEIRWNEVASEGEKGILFRANFHDRDGRSVLIMRPTRMQNIARADSLIRHMVYILENAVLNLPEDQERIAWLIDFDGWSLSNKISVKASREIVNVLQGHYGDRMGIAFLYNAPKIFEAFWAVIKYFIDPKVYKLVNFVYPKNKESMELMNSYFGSDNLPTEFGGKAKVLYDHQEYSRLMIQDELKAADKARYKCDDQKLVTVDHVPDNLYLNKPEVATMEPTSLAPPPPPPPAAATR